MHSASPYEAFFEPPPEIIFPSPERDFQFLSEMGDMSRYSPHYTTDESIGEAYLPEQSSYQSLFRSSREIPRFSVSYKWWEEEATTVLWTFDIQEIKRVIRYGLFRDVNLPRSALQSRNSSTIDTFLLTLVEPRETPFIANLSHVQKVEEILRRASLTNSPLVSWSWHPSAQDRELDAQSIAAAIDHESHLQFARISFEEWVRYSTGYSAAAVEWFLQQHTAFHIHLLNYFHSFPEQVAKYAEVEKLLRKRSPFAHRALVQSLLSVQAQGDLSISSSNAPGFEFIAGPIQQLFKDSPPSLKSILKVLSVLAVRFRQTYIHVPQMDWTLNFDTEGIFLDDLLASTSPLDFARTLTTLDEGLFAGVPEQNVSATSQGVQRLLTEWDKLNVAVWECCTGLPEMTSYILEGAQALFGLRNYHSLTAILNGIQKYTISELSSSNINAATGMVTLDPVLPTDSTYLINPIQNYAAYRQQFHQAPGIPFLLPHVRELKQQGKSALPRFFNSIRASIR